MESSIKSSAEELIKSFQTQDDEDSSNLTYEQIRDRNIQRNRKILESLGLHNGTILRQVIT